MQESMQHDHVGWFKRRRQVRVDDFTIVDAPALRRAVGAAALGNAMEWFDFGVYGYVAVTLGKVFFPEGDAAAQLLATLATFAVAFLARPLGGAVFGPLGDRFGRQKVLAATMIMMALGTFSIGLIPSYRSIGVAAPLLLLLARLVQGFSTGGEYGGAATFIAEYATDRRRGFMTSWLEFGTLGGYIAGAGTVTALNALLGEPAMLAWGWRVPFLVAGPLGLLGLYMRLKLEETPAFQNYAGHRQDGEPSAPAATLREVFALHWRQLLKCVGLVLVFNVTDYMLLTYMPSYLAVNLGYAQTTGLLLVLAVMLAMMPLTVLGGLLSDRLGRKRMIAGACLALLALAVPCLRLIGGGSAAGAFAGLMLLGMVLACFTSSMPATLPALFYTPVRYSALAIAFNVSVSLFGGTTPLFTAYLVERSGDPMVPAYYLMTAAVIGLLTVPTLRETAGKPLRGSPPAVADAAEARAVLRSGGALTVDPQPPVAAAPPGEEPPGRARPA